jgi:hypothetical protein
MTKHNRTESEALYIVVLHESQAEQRLKDWQKRNPTASASIAGGRMRLFDQRSLSLFQVSWRGNWDQITIWDTWSRRHIFLE